MSRSERKPHLHRRSNRNAALAPHPSLKPLAFLRKIVRALLPLGEGTVLDTFVGAASSLAAAEALGCASIGIEKDQCYFDTAFRRFRNWRSGNL